MVRSRRQIRLSESPQKLQVDQDCIEIPDSDDEVTISPAPRRGLGDSNKRSSKQSDCVIEIDDEDVAPLAGPSKFHGSTIDLTLDEEDACLHRKENSKASMDAIDLTSTSDGELGLASSTFKVNKGKKRAAPRQSFKAVLDQWFKDEEMLLSDEGGSYPAPSVASGILKDQETRALGHSHVNDQARTRQLPFDKVEQLLLPPKGKENKRQQRADEALARRLAKEEEMEYAKFIKTVDQKTEGIVFKIVVDATTNTLEDGSPAHADDLARFEPWRELFEKSGQKVKRFHWFVNYELEKRFEESRKKLREICGEEPEELQLFHGTAAPNVDLILQGGFRIGGQGGHPMSHGASYGHGIYLATDAGMSIGYAVGGNKIFACRVLPGRTTPNPMHNMPQVEVGTGTFEAFTAPGFYVVRHTALVLPCYMIEWDQPFGLMNWGALMAAPAIIPAPLLPLAPLLVPPAVPPAPPPRTTRSRKKRDDAVAQSSKKRVQTTKATKSRK